MKELLEGNVAMAEAAVRAGVEAYFGYPITPQTELLEHMAQRMSELDRVFLQAESEVAAINMVYGAACTGARAMTSSSSPGISLMQEGFSYIAWSEVPVVVVDVMRGGPGLGNIQPSQADYFQVTRSAGHGDYHPIVLAPASVQEAIDFDGAGLRSGRQVPPSGDRRGGWTDRADDGTRRTAADAAAAHRASRLGADRRERPRTSGSSPRFN